MSAPGFSAATRPPGPGLSPAQRMLMEGQALLQRGLLAPAQQVLAALLQAQPQHAEALGLAALVALRLNQPAQAVPLYQRLLRLQPQTVSAWANLGQAWLLLQRPAEALPALQQALALSPTHYLARLHEGVALRDLRRLDEALQSLDQALALQPDEPQALFHRAITLRRQERLDEALATYDALLRRQPEAADTHFNRANVLQELLRLPEAIAGYRQAIALNPQHAEAHCNLACALLMSGDDEHGLAEYEWRWRSQFIQEPAPPFTQPAWRGEQPIAGKTVLLYTEQGLGDAIQFSRYAAELARRGARVLLQAPALLLPLLQGLPGLHGLVAKGARQLPPFDVHCPLMSLPLALGVRRDRMPPQAPYLQARPDRLQRWAADLAGPGFKVGLCWQGSAAGTGAGRSFGVAGFEPLAALPGLRLFSLQKPEGPDEAPAGTQLPIHHFGPEFDREGAFLDSAAVIAQLDLVISADTAVAHLAGALGKPVWVLVKHVPDWRWGLGATHTPWYPSMRLYRQPRRGDWGPCFQAIAADLSALLAQRAT